MHPFLSRPTCPSKLEEGGVRTCPSKLWKSEGVGKQNRKYKIHEQGLTTIKSKRK